MNRLWRIPALTLILLVVTLGCAPRLQTTQLTFRDPASNPAAWQGLNARVSAQVLGDDELEQVFATDMQKAQMTAVKIVVHNQGNSGLMLPAGRMLALNPAAEMAQGYEPDQVIKTINDRIVGKETALASVKQGAGGALLGAAAGAAIGAVTGDSSRATGRGAAIGSVIGAGVGGGAKAFGSLNDVPAHVRTEVARVLWAGPVAPGEYEVGLVFFRRGDWNQLRFVVEDSSGNQLQEARIGLLPPSQLTD